MKLKKKYVITIAIAVIILVIGGCMSSASAAKNHKRHLPAKVCVKQWDNHGWKKQQCKRQGWYYERGMYPTYYPDTNTWVETPYVLVYSPTGRLRIDTAGMYSTPNVR